MKRKVFYSFHFKEDFWRTQQVRNIGSIEGNILATPNNWESIKMQGDQSIKNWIDTNMHGKSCLIVLVGANTANRKWINYEICQAWNMGLGILGIRINLLKDQFGYQSINGKSPFDFSNNGGNALFSQQLSRVVTIHEPYSFDSKACYLNIATNIDRWIEIAIHYRKVNL